ncbi:MAG: type II secretion system F family protein [Planctomycetota bacterium]|nr:type II secretion system F family protein [Planctomycetota bacterium]
MVSAVNIPMLSWAASLPWGLDFWDLFLSAGLFASVFTLIVAVFSQPGKVELSPQREVALATGHTDRRTVFEEPVLQPGMWLLLSVSHRLAIPRAKQWLGRTLVAAGSPNYYTAEEYLAVSMLGGLLAGCVLEAAHFLLTGAFSFVAIVIGFVAGMMLSLYRIHSSASTRIRAISKRLPYSLDLISLAMGAGATFTEAVRAVVQAEADDPFNVELRTTLAEIELGATRAEALQNLARRVPVELLRSIVASIIQAEQLGTPLADVLHSQAMLLRLQRSVRAENAAAVAGVRILIPGLLILMAVILAVFAPFIVKIIRGGLF